MTEAGSRLAARMTRLSFVDGRRAAELLTGDPLRWWDAERNQPVDDDAAVVVAALGRTADPGATRGALADIAAQPEGAARRDAVGRDPALRSRLLALLGVSSELAAHLGRHAADWTVLRGELHSAGTAERLAAAVGADAGDPVTG